MVRLATLATVAAATGLAALSMLAGPSKAQNLAKSDSARYRFALVRVTLPADSEGAPLTIDQVAAKDHPRIPFRSERATLAGYFCSVQHPHDVVGRLGALGPAEVVFRGELEGAVGESCRLSAGREFPVRSMELRGDQRIVTTKFQKTGATVEIRAIGNDDHELQLEFAAVSAWSEDGQPVMFTAGTQGRLYLPDGYTAVFDFLDRAEAESLTRPISERVTDLPQKREETSRDVVARFFFLLTRLDLPPR